MRRQVGPGAHAVMVQQGGDHPHGRGLAVRADDVDRAEGLVRCPQRRHEPPHAVQPEAHAEQLEREQPALGRLGVHGLRGADVEAGARHSDSSSARSRSSLARSPSTTAAGAFATKPWLESFFSARAISARSVALLVQAPLGGAEVDVVGGEDRDRSARHGDARHLGAIRCVGEVEASHRPHPLGRRVVAVGVQHRGHDRAGPHADRVAPAAQPADRLDRPRHLGLGLAIHQRAVGRRQRARRQQPLAARQQLPQLLGDERDHRVRGGDRLAQDVQQRRAERRALAGVGIVRRVAA